MHKKPWSNLKKLIVIMSVTVAVVAVVTAIEIYVNDYYEATETATRAMLGSDLVQVTEEEDNYVFTPVDTEIKGGIIFYPGGKVEETAYAPLMTMLAETGYQVYLVHMPVRLAVLDSGAADDIIEAHSEITDWTMMGHSLGGAMAAYYTSKHTDTIENLVLLAAYSTRDLSDSDVNVYCFYGSEDGVLNLEKFEENRSNLPEDAYIEVIEGGNHADYAYYGAQDGDGLATISREAQQQEVLDVLIYCGVLE